ncbi:MAG TPA: alpha-amylase family glycosyl hydrolase [Steroidobacteraceae bacterium]|nr:alpha-amylase family glycosyl hydrolase [Steroidobacteraceae bacterium]
MRTPAACHRPLWAALGALALLSSASAADFRARLPQDEVLYFLLPDRFENGDPANDRGGLEGGPLATGFDPSHKGFFHGGDLKGVLARLDYIQSLGATAVWLAPIFKNKAVQGPPGHESAGYHGYWITDFTRVDPHFGTEEDLKALITAAHRRGMKVYLDIVANHTADVIRYRECPDNNCPYRSHADYPYTRRGGIGGEPINPGFLGDDAAHQTAENFAHLTRPDYAYTPYVPRGEEHVKVPDWLNDPIYYHNRGNSTFAGESSTFGDFAGLDDLMTENPRVVQGFIEIYGGWIERFGVDGFRIDTARHVNPEFWQQFVPAMLTAARAAGIPNFHMFGEVASGEVDPALLAEHTRVDRLPAVLDFAFAAAVRQTVGGKAGTDVLARLFEGDALYEGGAAAAQQLPTFLSNHDGGRFAYFVRRLRPGIGDEETLRRVLLAHAMLFTLRGVPVVYYGDEQGFAGLGGDQDARQDMFVSRVASYLSERPLGGASSQGSHFDPRHPLYRAIAELAQLRTAQPALRRGTQLVRASGSAPGLFAVSRLDPDGRGELLIAFNTSTSAVSAQVMVEAASERFVSLHGRCEPRASAPGSYHVEIAPLDYLVCAAAGGE